MLCFVRYEIGTTDTMASSPYGVNPLLDYFLRVAMCLKVYATMQVLRNAADPDALENGIDKITSESTFHGRRAKTLGKVEFDGPKNRRCCNGPKCLSAILSNKI